MADHTAVSHKEWDCKDDLNFFEFNNSGVKLSLLPSWLQSFYSLFDDKAKKEQVYSCRES